jgi:hypothetical protein
MSARFFISARRPAIKSPGYVSAPCEQGYRDCRVKAQKGTGDTKDHKETLEFLGVACPL